MLVVGLTGSIAMGKSEVAKRFTSASIPVFDSDREVHAFYDSERGVEVLHDYAPEVIVNGKIDRTVLSRIALSDRTRLDQLEKLIHGEISERRKRFIAEAEEQGHALVLVDIPLLFETQAEKSLDVTIVVSSPPEMQRQRALARPNMTAEKLDRILARQMPDVEKRKRADFVIENNGSLEELHDKADQLIAKLKDQVRHA